MSSLESCSDGRRLSSKNDKAKARCNSRSRGWIRAALSFAGGGLPCRDDKPTAMGDGKATFVPSNRQSCSSCQSHSRPIQGKRTKNSTCHSQTEKLLFSPKSIDRLLRYSCCDRELRVKHKGKCESKFPGGETRIFGIEFPGYFFARTARRFRCLVSFRFRFWANASTGKNGVCDHSRRLLVREPGSAKHRAIK